jgi:outer membrane protein TolC
MHHPSIMSATGSLDASRSRISQAKAGYYPQINLSNGYSRIHPAGGSGTTGVGKDSYDRYQSSVNVDQTLFDFGKTSSQVRVNTLGTDATRADLEDVTSQVIFGVEQAFYGMFRSRQSKDAYGEAVLQFEQRLAQARRFYEVGLKPKIDVTKAEVDLSQARLNLVKADNALRIARITLNNAMGVPEAPVYEVRESPGGQDYPVTLEEAIRRGYESRPDLASVRAKREASEQSIDLAYKGYYPVLSGNAGYGWTGQSFPLDKEWSLGATLTFPLFSGFSTRYQVEEARANLEVLQSNEALIRQNVRFDVEQAYSNLRQAREAIVLAELTVKQAKENRELAQGRYAAGVGNAIEVTDAIVTEINAKTAYISSLYDERLAVAGLKKAMGEIQ